MGFDDANTWAMIVTICALALFIEAVFIARTLILRRQKLRWYLLLLFPLGVCAWSIIVASNVITQSGQLYLLTGLHMTYPLFQGLRDQVHQLIVVCQAQIVIIVAVFVLCAVVERKALPHVNEHPLWTRAREWTVRGW
jgi:hypothetical protein